MNTTPSRVPRSHGILIFTTQNVVLASLVVPTEKIEQLSDAENTWVLITKVIGSTALILGLHMI